MTESRRNGLQIAAWVSFVVGLMLFLVQAGSTGQALENFKLSVSSSALSIVGASVALLAAIALAVLHFLGRKNRLKHP